MDFDQKEEKILNEAMDMLPETAERVFDEGNYNLDDITDLYLFTADLFEAISAGLRKKKEDIDNAKMN